MNNEIDSLSLKIEVKGLTKKQIENIRDLSESLRLLNDTLKGCDFEKLEDFIWSSMGAGSSLSSLAKGFTKLSASIKELDTEKLKALPTLQVFNFDNKAIENGAKAIEAQTQAQESLNTALKENQKIKKGKKVTAVGSDTQQAIKEAKQAGEAVTEDGKKSPSYYEKPNAIVKLIRRIKLIAFIKLIRGALNAIIKGFQQGIQQLAIYSKDFNKTMSQMVTAFDKVKASTALIAQPFMEALLPAIQALSGIMVEVANTISKLNAMSKGLSEYTKISSKYAKDYAQSMQKGALFSFDTFETLNIQETPYETAPIDEEDTENGNEMLSIIENIKKAGETISKVVKTILPTIIRIGEILSPILDQIIDTSNEATEDILPVVKDLLDLISEVLAMFAPMVRDILKALDPVIKAINVDILPNVMKLLRDIITPIAKIISALPIAEIVGLIVETLKPGLEIISGIIEIIDSILSPIFNIISEIIVPLVKDLEPALKFLKQTFEDITKDLSSFFDVFKNIFDLLFALWSGDTGKMEEAFKKLLESIGRAIANVFLSVIRGVVRVVESIVNLFIEAINKVIANEFIKWIANDVFGGDWQGITWRADWASKITFDSFANGGIVGEIWQMNEYGNPEMLYNANNNGNTAVITQDQLAQAFEQAIYRTGIIQAIEDDKVVVIDGKAVAQSSSFKRELNRTNPKLALK